MKNAFKLAVAVCVTFLCLAASATDLIWDGKTYLNIGLRLGADTAIVFPEPVEISAENPSAFEEVESNTDARILAVRPLTAQEQRVTFIGTQTKTVYLARFSTREGFSPLYRIQSKVADQQARTERASQTTPASLMRAMMADTIPPGFERRPLVQPLLSGPEYKIVSTEIVESPRMTGLIVTISLNASVASALVRPGDISIQIPSLGQVRMMGADRWDLDADSRTTTGYFVFSR